MIKLFGCICVEVASRVSWDNKSGLSLDTSDTTGIVS